MAETRKHKITVRDELDAQLLAQLGDQSVRPYAAGHFHRTAGEPSPDAPATPSTPASGLVTSPGVLGSFTFKKASD